MAKPTIVTRAGKGSALTWTEGDANFTNLRDATLTVSDGTTTKALNLNDTLTFTAGNNMTVSVNATTGAVTISTTATTNTGTVTQVNALSIGTTGTDISSTVANSTTTPTITINIPTASSSNRGALSSGDWSTFNGKQAALVSGTNIKTINSSSILGSGDLAVGTVTSVTGTSGRITSSGGATPAIDLASGIVTAGTYQGSVTVDTYGRVTAGTNTLVGYGEGSIFDLGTTGGTIAPNVSNGNVQKITLNSALTLNAFTSPVAGQSMTLIIYGGTAYTSVTSTMKFAGGTKTLTGTVGCIDIMSIYYDGTTYFASISKGFA